jgi:hypothetical protein
MADSAGSEWSGRGKRARVTIPVLAVAPSQVDDEDRRRRQQRAQKELEQSCERTYGAGNWRQTLQFISAVKRIHTAAFIAKNRTASALLSPPPRLPAHTLCMAMPLTLVDLHVCRVRVVCAVS